MTCNYLLFSGTIFSFVLSPILVVVVLYYFWFHFYFSGPFLTWITTVQVSFKCEIPADASGHIFGNISADNSAILLMRMATLSPLIFLPVKNKMSSQLCLNKSWCLKAVIASLPVPPTQSAKHVQLVKTSPKELRTMCSQTVNLLSFLGRIRIFRFQGSRAKNCRRLRPLDWRGEARTTGRSLMSIKTHAFLPTDQRSSASTPLCKLP